MKTRKHWSGWKTAVGYITVPTPKELPAVAKAALEAGVPIVHVGLERCAFCGTEIDAKVQDVEVIGDINSAKQKVFVHLCDDCWKARGN